MAFNVMPQIGPPVQLSEMDASYSQPGVYFLWQGDAVVYVGQSRDMTRRVLEHACDRMKQFDGISCKPCHPQALLKKERFFIEALLPRYNRCGLSKSVRKTWVGHMDAKADLKKRVGHKTAAKILGVTAGQLNRLTKCGLRARTVVIPRANVRRSSYLVKDLHQFAAQMADRIIEVRQLYPGT